MSNTKRIAEEAELHFASEFVRAGWSVFFPFGENSSVDLLIFRDGIFRKVQVKASKPISGSLTCKLRSTNNWQDKRYSSDQVDVFALYDYVNQRGYLLEFKEFAGMSQVTFRLEGAKNNQVKGVRSALDYRFF